MRHRLAFASPLVLLLLGSLAFVPGASTGCSSDDSATGDDSDAGDASTPDADFTENDDAGDGAYPSTDATVVACTLHSSTNDPVGLCTQKTVLTDWKANARTAAGIASGWSATTGAVVTDGGATVHDFHDDLGYGSAIADYHRSSNCYGDNQITGVLDDDLADIQPLLLSELSPLPAEYRGDTYFRLRRIAAGLRYINETTKADAIDAVAEAYGTALAANYFVDLGPIATGGAALDGGTTTDAGSAGDAGNTGIADASAGDASALDAGDAGTVTFDDGVVGTPTGGAASYRPADTAMAALALLDLASRHTSDNAPGAAILEAAAAGTFYHLARRAKDASGFYFTELSTSTTGTHDTPTDTSGTFSTDVQSQVAFAFLDAARIATANTALHVAATLPLVVTGEALIAAMNATPSLYDPTNLGYYASITPGTSTVDTTKTTLANAYMLQTARDDLDNGTASATFIGQDAPLKGLFVGTSSGGGFLGAVTGQRAYLSAQTATFAPIGNADPVYSSAATAAALTALNHELPADCGE